MAIVHGPGRLAQRANRTLAVSSYMSRLS